MTSTSSGRGWAYTGAILGGFISVAANIAHSYIRPTGAPADWSPEPGAVISAMAWPIVLFVAVEILARTPWPNKASYHLLRWLGLPPVAFVAALVSYRHLSGLLAHYGEEPLVQRLGPIAIDGLMLMATGALLATRHLTQTEPAPATTTAEPTTPTATLPTITTIRDQVPASRTASLPIAAADRAEAIAPEPAAAAAGADRSPDEPHPARSASPTSIEPTEQADTIQHRHETVPVAPEQAPAASAPDIPVTAADAAPPLKLPVPAALLTRARHIATAHQEANQTPITPGQLAARLRVDTGTAKQILALLDLDPNRLRHPAMTANGTAMDRTA